MSLPIEPSYPPMDARLVAQLPKGPHWQYEPKWDGFRCLAFGDHQKIDLQSKSDQPLARYFPELVEALRQLKAEQFVLDGEIVIPSGEGLSFDALLQRIHPAESRIRKLSIETPAVYLVFDLLVDAQGRSLAQNNLADRRRALETFARKILKTSPRILLSPATKDLSIARRWYAGVGAALDGVIAKRLDLPYQSGNRDGMVKVKQLRTADCVVGGFRYGTGKKVVGSLLLGLYDEKGLLNHVGYTSTIPIAERAALTKKLEKLVEPPGFTGNHPGGPSRWSTQRSGEWQPLSPKLVVEVRYDHFTNGRFRHGTKLLRWRPDKKPHQCTMAQVRQEAKVSPMKLISA